MKSIGIVGAGTMGSGIAHVASLSQYSVLLMDINEHLVEKGINSINSNMDRQIKKNSITPDDKQIALDRISLTTELNDLKSVDFVIEAATEDRKIKGRIFQELDKICKEDTILTTNTSSISITDIGSFTKRPEKVIGMHFMNPVPVMKLVEIISGYSTSKETLATVTKLAEQLGKTPVPVNDYPGFVANRILMPMLNEAIETLYNGVAGVQEIDTVMKLGMAHPMGPLQLADFIGLDVCLSILEVMYDGFKNPKYAPCPLLVNMVRAGKLGVKSGEGFYDYSESRKAETVSAQFQ